MAQSRLLLLLELAGAWEHCAGDSCHTSLFYKCYCCQMNNGDLAVEKPYLRRIMVTFQSLH